MGAGVRPAYSPGARIERVTTILAFLFVLGVLVFVHELGHFVAARRIGVRVLSFSLGFGPKLLTTRRGDTEYAISAIPLGGYVKMAGESVDDPRSGAPDEFLSKTKWQRFQILIMGPAMNILLAIVLLACVLMTGETVPAYVDQPAVVGSIERDSPAERAGFAVGDLITNVAGQPIRTWDDVDVQVGLRPDREIPVTVMRNGKPVTLTVRSEVEERFEVGRIGVSPNVHPVVRSVNPGEPAERAGLKPGDVVLAVDGRAISFPRQLSDAISKSPDKPITLTIRRDGRLTDIRVTPALKETGGMIGIGIGAEVREIVHPPLEALRLSFVRTWEMSGQIMHTLWGLLTGETSPKQLMGPVGIAQLSGESAEQGWTSLVNLMATISLNLGLLNLLPIPVLDGGHILILALEGVARRNFSMRVKERMLLAGFVLLLMLMITVIYNDLTRISWVENLMFWR
jgi:regulator of sigma E protease